jgi:hypothetical protein
MDLSNDFASHDIFDVVKSDDSEGWKRLLLVDPNFRHAMLLNGEEIAQMRRHAEGAIVETVLTLGAPTKSRI